MRFQTFPDSSPSKFLFLVEQIECYQDAGILLTIQDSKFIVRDLFSPDVELPDVIGKCQIFAIFEDLIMIS